MMQQVCALPPAVIQVVVLAVGWFAVFRFNSYALGGFELSERANWIFLPAALRVIYPLVFRKLGVLALILGGCLVLPAEAGRLEYRVALAVLSGLTPVVGIAACKALLLIRSDLRGLRPVDLILLAVSCALANGVILNTFLLLTGYPVAGITHAAATFVGDVLSTLIVLQAISWILALPVSAARRSPGRWFKGSDGVAPHR